MLHIALVGMEEEGARFVKPMNQEKDDNTNVQEMTITCIWFNPIHKIRGFRVKV